MVRLAIIGCGGMGNMHSGKLSRMPNVQIKYACDVEKQKADELAGKINAEPIQDYKKILKEVDAVWECSPPFMRPDIVIECAKAGKHIFSEKPMALNLKTADKMAKAIQEAGIIFMVGYVLRFTNPYRIAHEIFASGELGKLVNVYMRRYMPADLRGRWYADQKKSGGVMLDFGSHDLDILQWFGGRPKAVFAHTERIRDKIEADDHAQTMLVFNEGMGTSDVSWWSPGGTNSFGVVGTRGSLIAESGVLRKSIAGEKEVIVGDKMSAVVDPKGNIGEKKEDGNIKLNPQANESIQEHFIRCVEEKKTPLVSIKEARGVLEIVTAAQKSTETGKSVEIK